MTSPGASNFNPSPLEWVVFTAGLNAAHGAAHSFMDTAVATNWGVWYFDKYRYKPSWLIPEAYACARYFSALTVGVAWWLGMREIIRSQFAPSETDEGVATPSNHYVFLFNLFWILYVFLSRSFSSSFFVHGLGKGYMASPFFNEVGIFACVVTMGVFGGLIWYPVGILLAFPMAFYLVSIALLISFWAYNKHPEEQSRLCVQNVQDRVRIEKPTIRQRSRRDPIDQRSRRSEDRCLRSCKEHAEISGQIPAELVG